MASKLILLVEDNPDDELLTLRALKKANIDIRIEIARDGAEALDYIFREGSELPQLILLDLRLPKISGLQVLERIRSD
jgi:two-component system response regulator